VVLQRRDPVSADAHAPARHQHLRIETSGLGAAERAVGPGHAFHRLHHQARLGPPAAPRGIGAQGRQHGLHFGRHARPHRRWASLAARRCQQRECNDWDLVGNMSAHGGIRVVEGE
jgi:hypothetical protein